jgi:hypothetical protein
MNDLKNLKNWVIITHNGNAFHYETFDEALRMTKIISGHLMSKEYYEFHYNKGDK